MQCIDELLADVGGTCVIVSAKLRHLGRCRAGRRRLSHASGACGQVWSGLKCDDLRLVDLKLIFLVVTQAVSHCVIAFG
jgi:hypothetical protein